MAIQDGNNGGNLGQAAAPQDAGNKPMEIWSFHQQGITNSPIAPGYGGEYLQKFKAGIAEILKDIADGVESKIITLARQHDQRLKFSAIVIAIRLPSVSNDVAAFHTLILEGTNEPVVDVIRQIDNQNVSIHRVTGDAWDDVLIKAAEQAVLNEYKQGVQVFSAAAERVPRDVSVMDKEQLDVIVRNSALACVSSINLATGNFNPLNLSHMDRDCRFKIDLSFGNHQVLDIYKQPSRASVLIGFNSVRTGKKIPNQVYGELINVQDETARICELAGYVSPVWSPKVPVNQHFGYHYGVPQDPQRFVAEFTVTSVHTDFATSPAAVLLALSSALTVSDGNKWLQALLPSKSVQQAQAGQVDITDIGALNITANIQNQTHKGIFGDPMDTALFKADHEKALAYLYTLFQPGVIISIDVPEVGADSWFLSVFADCAAGDKAAYDLIYNSAEELTNNIFGTLFKNGSPIFNSVSRVPLGYYVRNGVKQDLRAIDYIAIANLFQQNPQAIHDYSNTFVDRPGVSSARNLSMREGMIRAALNHSVEINGYAAHVVFAESFLKAISMAISQLGLPVEVHDPATIDLQRTGIMSPSYVASSLLQNTQTFGGGYYAHRGPMQQYRPRAAGYYGGSYR